jgi:hypothetical protein
VRARQLYGRLAPSRPFSAGGGGHGDHANLRGIATLMRPNLLLKSVNAILFEVWDPIGVRSIDAAWPQDEYDSYAPGVVALVKRGASDHAIADHLGTVEQERMGIASTAPEHRLKVARLVRASVEGFERSGGGRRTRGRT